MHSNFVRGHVPVPNAITDEPSIMITDIFPARAIFPLIIYGIVLILPRVIVVILFFLSKKSLYVLMAPTGVSLWRLIALDYVNYIAVSFRGVS
jgi:hypothetical protein